MIDIKSGTALRLGSQFPTSLHYESTSLGSSSAIFDSPGGNNSWISYELRPFLSMFDDDIPVIL